VSVLVVVCVAAGCSRKLGGDPLEDLGGDGAVQGSGASAGEGMDGGGLFGNAPSSPGTRDSGLVYRDAESIAEDAFFVKDPPPPYCGPDGDMQPQPPGGTPECPADKNREGCPCEAAGATAACWPGKRINRNHGICVDGTTSCRNTVEFGLRWGPCEGYVLPEEGALSGPSACRCFSSGKWQLSNLAPCIYRGSATYLYSSTLTSDGKINCGANVPEPPPVPAEDWSTSILNVDCAGQFELCYTIKAGDAANPRADDCVIMQQCMPVWYPEEGVDQALPALAAWSSPNAACARTFDTVGGYGEMTVLGESIECEAVDDGSGNPYVFHRTDYCPPSCQNTPNTPECRDCQTGGSGDF
jgi:hypothetical protein